jgi:hypothetical protein
MSVFDLCLLFGKIANTAFAPFAKKEAEIGFTASSAADSVTLSESESTRPAVVSAPSRPPMSPRLLFEVAMRIVGVWFLFQGLDLLTWAVTWHFSQLQGISMFGSPSLWPTYANLVIETSLGIALIGLGPRLARYLYPETENPSTDSARQIGPGDLYHTDCFVLGVYLLVQAVEPGSQIALTAIQGQGLAALMAESASTLIVLVTYLVAGLVLVFGARPISAFLSHLRYDPQTIPKQHISLGILLIVIVVIAGALTFLRRMSGP